MRVLEIILLLILVIAVFVRGRLDRRGRMGLVGVGALVLLLHWVIEGNRWQMSPAYVAALIGGASLLLAGGLGKWVRRMGGMLMVLAIGFSFWASVVFPVVRLGELAGEYDVGTVTYHLIDESRDEPQTVETGDFREIMVQVWYPADVDGEPLAPFVDNNDVIGPIVMRSYGLPPFLLNHLGLIESRSYLRPVVSEEVPFPVLVFIHGWGGLRSQNTRQMETLASEGWIVVAADHTFGAGVTVFPDGRVAEHKVSLIAFDTPAEQATANALVRTWADDVAFMLDELAVMVADPNHRFANAINFDQLGVFGHSTGGGATYEFCKVDARCKAALGLDPWVFPMSDVIVEEGIEQPMLSLATPRTLGEENKARLQAFYDGLFDDAYLVEIAETGHNDFTDFTFISPLLKYTGLTGTIGAVQVAEIVDEYTLAFFEHHVRGWGGAILYGDTAYFDEVTIQSKP